MRHNRVRRASFHVPTGLFRFADIINSVNKNGKQRRDAYRSYVSGSKSLFAPATPSRRRLFNMCAWRTPCEGVHFSSLRFFFWAFYYSCIKYSLSISHPSTTRWMRDTLLHSCVFSLFLHRLHFNFLCSYSHLLFNLSPLLLSFPFSTIYLFIMHSHHLFLLFPPSSPSSLCKYSFGRETENEWVGGEGWVSIRAAASSFHVVTNITQRLTGGN